MNLNNAFLFAAAEHPEQMDALLKECGLGLLFLKFSVQFGAN